MQINPLYRVAGAHARYFSGRAPTDMALAVRQWLHSHAEGKSPQSAAMHWMRWKESIQAMLAVMLKDQWQDRWEPMQEETLVARYWGSDMRLPTIAGRREGTQLVSTGHKGYLLHGPYLDLKPGSYVAEIRGSVGRFGLGDARADICMDGGDTVLLERPLKAPDAGREGVLAALPFTLQRAGDARVGE